MLSKAHLYSVIVESTGEAMWKQDVNAPKPDHRCEPEDYELSAEELSEIDEAIAESAEDIRLGRTRPAEDVLAEIMAKIQHCRLSYPPGPIAILRRSVPTIKQITALMARDSSPGSCRQSAI